MHWYQGKHQLNTKKQRLNRNSPHHHHRHHHHHHRHHHRRRHRRRRRHLRRHHEHVFLCVRDCITIYVTSTVY